jgi:hypothetical protein
MEGEARAAGAAAVIAKEIGAATLIDQLRELCDPALHAEHLPAAG